LKSFENSSKGRKLSLGAPVLRFVATEKLNHSISVCAIILHYNNKGALDSITSVRSHISTTVEIIKVH